jgi:hypothetical protein
VGRGVLLAFAAALGGCEVAADPEFWYWVDD